MILGEIHDDILCAASEQALVEARLAERAGSFAVGACLVARDGRILARARNRVAGDESKHDPTAHAERRLIDWYYSQRARGLRLPDEGDIAIVGTIEPCMMCAGALLSARIGSVSLCEDPGAGVGIARDYACLLPALRPAARSSIQLATPYNRACSPQLKNIAAEAGVLFGRTLERVRRSVSRQPLRVVASVGFGDQMNWPAAKLRRREMKSQIAGIRLGNGEPVMPHSRNTASPIGYPVLELIRTIAREGVVASCSADRSSLQFVVAGAFESAQAIVTSLGAIGSFAEGPVERHPYVVFQDVSDADVAQVVEALELFPPLYRDLIGITVAMDV